MHFNVTLLENEARACGGAPINNNDNNKFIYSRLYSSYEPTLQRNMDKNNTILLQDYKIKDKIYIRNIEIRRNVNKC